MNPHDDRNEDSSSSSNGEDDFQVNEDDDLTPQLQTLQSMINPNMNTTDKRTILEETHKYLLQIHQETERLEKELSQHPNNPSSSSSPPVAGEDPKIISIEVEELMEGRFVVKMNWRRGFGMNGHVQRVIEQCLDVTMMSMLVNDKNPEHMLSTAFVQVKEERKITEEELHGLLMNTAARLGLLP